MYKKVHMVYVFCVLYCGGGQVNAAVTQRPFYEDKCVDKDEACAIKAADGLCETDVEYMHTNCQVSCDTCLDSEDFDVASDAVISGSGSGSGDPEEQKYNEMLITAKPLLPLTPTMTTPDRNLCGIKPGKRRIVGDRKSKHGAWPWMIGLAQTDSKEEVVCGASLITDQYVITAAHCVSENKNHASYKVRLGEKEIHVKDGSERVETISKIIIHEKYNEYSLDNDIALLKLTNKVKFNRFILPICLPDDVMIPTHFKNSDCVVTGWGKVREDGPLSYSLKEAKVPLVSRAKCKKQHPLITENMICAGYDHGKVDSCEGDSGGPLACFSQSKRRHYLIGIVSWGEGCARKGTYGIYTNVKKLREWIEAKIRDN